MVRRQPKPNSWTTRVSPDRVEARPFKCLVPVILANVGVAMSPFLVEVPAPFLIGTGVPRLGWTLNMFPNPDRANWLNSATLSLVFLARSHPNFFDEHAEGRRERKCVGPHGDFSPHLVDLHPKWATIRTAAHLQCAYFQRFLAQGPRS